MKIKFFFLVLLFSFFSTTLIPSDYNVGTVEAKKRKKKKKGPASKPKYLDIMSLSGKDINRDELADRKREEAITALKLLIKKVPKKHPSRADLYFRLAELYWEKAKSRYFREMKAYEKKLSRYHELSSKGKKVKEPKPNHRESVKVRKNALKIYTILVKKYPRYPRLDQVYFNLGYNLYEMGNKRKGVSYYWRLIKKFPNSIYVPDAYLAIGEKFFSENKLTKAIIAYNTALKYTQSKVYIYALYKLAWCDYNLTEYEKAIQKFKDVISYSRNLSRTSGKKDTNRIRLEREALRDIVLAYSQTDIGEGAREYFDSIAGAKEGRKLFSKLGVYYIEQGKNELAIQVFMALIDEDPNSPKAPDFQNKIVVAYDKMNDKNRAAKALNKLVDEYSPNSAWAQANSNNQRALEKAFRLTQTALRDLVTQYHNEAQKTKSDKTYEVAQKMYRKYLETFPKSKDSYNMRFYFAEILYLRQEFRPAAEQYELVVKQNEKGRYTKNSAYNAILAREKVALGVKKSITKRTKLNEKKRKGRVKQKIKLTKLVKGKDYTKKDIPEKETLLAAACDTYFRLFPKDLKELPTIKFKAAFIFHKYNHFEEAAKRFFDIIQKFPRNEFSRKAMDLVLNSFEVKDDWKNLNKWARTFHGNKKLMDTKIKGIKKFKGQLSKVIQGSQFKIVQGLNDEKKTVEAAKGFIAFYKEFPKSEFSDKALYNAVDLLTDLKKIDLSIKYSEIILKKYPKTKLKEKVTLNLAKLYEKVADYKTVISYNTKFLKTYKKSDKFCDTLFNTYVFQQGLEDHKGALKNLSLYLKKCTKKNKEEVPKLYYRTAQLQEKLGKKKKALKIYKTYIKKHGRKVSPEKVFDAYLKLYSFYKENNNKKAIASLMKTISAAYKPLNEDAKGHTTIKNAYAMSQFYFMTPRYLGYMNIKFTGSMKKDKKALEFFQKKYPEIAKSYNQIMEIGDKEYWVASLVRLGQMNWHFSTQLLNAPIPKQLKDPEQQDMYSSILADKAAPVEERAVQAFEKAANKSYELEFYTSWTKKAQDMYQEISGSGYDISRELPLRFMPSYRIKGAYLSEK